MTKIKCRESCFDSDVRKFMQRAIELSTQNMRSNKGGPFGAIIVKDNKIIAEGGNEVTSENDPTAHAEIVAIRRACKKLNTFNLEGCIIYASCEPCPMCLCAIYWARLDALYFAGTREDATRAGFDDTPFYKEVAADLKHRTKKTCNCCREEAQKVFEEWIAKPDKIQY